MSLNRNQLKDAVEAKAVELKDKIVTSESGLNLPITAYEESLAAAEIDIEVVKKINDHDQVYIPGAQQSLLLAAVDNLAKHKTAESVNGTVEMFGRTLETQMVRERTSRNPATGEEIVKQGAFNAQLKTDSFPTAGIMTQVKKHVSDYAIQKLGK